ncbi:hypothetical protein E4U39_006432 [Claviceps sp. Clav50 group G5]|nr:hypothetical protein E4U39_006432 [Claviceps sp. Clav50 group G5]
MSMHKLNIFCASAAVSAIKVVQDPTLLPIRTPQVAVHLPNSTANAAQDPIDESSRVNRDHQT